MSIQQNFLNGTSVCTLHDIIFLEDEVKRRLLFVLGRNIENIGEGMRKKLYRILSEETLSGSGLHLDHIIDPLDIIKEASESEENSLTNEIAKIFLPIYLLKDMRGMSFRNAICSLIRIIRIHSIIPPVGAFKVLMKKNNTLNLAAPQFGIYSKDDYNDYYNFFDSWYLCNKEKIDALYGDKVVLFYDFMNLLGASCEHF